VDYLVLDARRAGAAEQLDLAASLLEASVRHGVTTHLSIGYAQTLIALDTAVRLLPAPPSDLTERVERLLEGLRHQAFDLAGRGADIPAHEVSYEQSIVAPLVSLLSLAYRRWADDRLLRRPNGHWGGCWPSVGDTTTSACATLQSAIGMATGSGCTGSGATSFRITGRR
jgi:hypothetical protein